MGHRLKLSEVEVRAARVLLGMKGHRPSAKSACVGGKLRGKTYAEPEKGMGGRNNPAVHKAFVEAGIACGFNVSPATRRKFGL